MALAGDDTVVAYFAKYGGKLAGGPTPEPELSWDAAIVTYGADQSVKRRLDFEDVLELDAMSVGPDGSIALLLEGRSDTELSYQGKTLPGFTGSGGLLVVKPDGSLGWTKSSYARNPTLAFGADGSLYIAGRVSEANGVYDGVVEKYDPSGVQAWVKTIKTGAPNNETVSGMAITPGGDVFVAGYHQKPITIDGASLEGSDTAWIAKLAASDGTAVWAADVDGMHEPRVSLLGSGPRPRRRVHHRALQRERRRQGHLVHADPWGPSPSRSPGTPLTSSSLAPSKRARSSLWHPPPPGGQSDRHRRVRRRDGRQRRLHPRLQRPPPHFPQHDRRRHVLAIATSGARTVLAGKFRKRCRFRLRSRRDAGGEQRVRALVRLALRG